MHTFEIQGSSVVLKVVRFTGSEALNELFHFTVTVASPDPTADVAALAGEKAALTIDIGHGKRVVHGLVRRVDAADGGHHVGANYHVELVPTHYRMALRRDLRIFQEKTAVEIIQKVVEGAGLKIDVKVSASYPTREYCVQYRETDWDFVARLAEDEGITLSFAPDTDECTLVLTDNPSAHDPISSGDGSLPLRGMGGALVSSLHVSLLRTAGEMRSGKATLRDYNFKKPHLLVEGAHKAEADGELEVYDYPGLHDSPSGGKALARLRQEAEEAVRGTVHGESNAATLVPGATFKLTEHPRDAVNISYLIVRVLTEGSDPQMFASGDAGTPFSASFDAMPADKPFRPARVTPRPRIAGFQTGVVVGPPGEEIHVDEFGRVKVQFHWDRLGKKDDKSSCWMRVSQPWAGAGFGAIAIPRIGHEVVIGFLEGDPDRPLITGSVYHGANAPPYSLPAEKTRTAIFTQSSPGGGGHNELRFEDRKGLEEVFLRAQKDLNEEILHDRTEHVGHDEKVTIDQNRTHKVGMNDQETVGVDKTVNVGANHTEVVGANLTVSVGANISLAGSAGMTVTLDGDASTKIEGSSTHEIHKDSDQKVDGASTLKVGKEMTTTVSGEYKLNVDKDHSVAVSGSSSEDVEKKKTVQVGETYTLECGDGKITVQKNGDIVIEGKSIKIKGSGPITVEGSKLKVKTDGTVDVDAGGAVKVKGGTVDLN
ncbi:MAG: type VI secretion system tip protein TssI/VgrG [Polyangiaceae bacterium]